MLRNMRDDALFRLLWCSWGALRSYAREESRRRARQH